MQKEQAKKVVGTTKEFWEAMERNGFHMPPKNNAINTMEYMQKVREGKYWVPTYQKMKQRPCVKPPKKSILVKEVLMAAKEQKLELGIKDGKEPTVQWLLVALATLNEDHWVFKKDYYPTHDELTENPKQRIFVDNSDSFFSNLPPSRKKGRAVDALSDQHQKYQWRMLVLQTRQRLLTQRYKQLGLIACQKGPLMTPQKDHAMTPN